MNLTQPTSTSNSGRGIYSYKVEIKLGNEVIDDEIETIGKVEISENTQPIIVEGFSVQDGYKDRFVFKWKNKSNRKYVVSMSDDKKNWKVILTVNPNPNDSDTSENDNYSVTYEEGITPGLTKYFAIQPYRILGIGNEKGGQMVYATAASKTLGVPELTIGGSPSYSTITALWTPAQKADAYRIRYWYNGETAKTKLVPLNDPNLALNANNKYEYKFVALDNNAVDVSKAGLDIQVEVDALNQGLAAAAGIGEIATTSKENAKTRLVGPALLNPGATRAVSPTQIDVSWDKVAGADGYYVFRRQFDMDNNYEEGTESIVYYIPKNGTSIIGKNLALDTSNAKEDTAKVKASVSSGNRLVLHDIYMPDTDYFISMEYNRHTPAYKNQQNDMAQGFSYRYYIVPVVDRGGSPEPLSNIMFFPSQNNGKNTSISAYTIKENDISIRYNNASSLEKEGFIIGFGYNVIATKGTYASSGDVNNGIQITWELPKKLADAGIINPRYTLHRRAYQGTGWYTFDSTSDKSIVDTTAERGITHEYVVGIARDSASLPSDPRSSQRFVDRCKEIRDGRSRPNFLGFMLGYVRMASVTRGEDSALNAQLGERVTWQGSGIQNGVSGDNIWGIDGYTVFIMNRNISNQWYEVADNLIPDQTQGNQSVVLTPGNTPSITLTDSIGTITRNVLFVLRDYKHFYRVRSYVQINEEKRIYGPVDTTWSYQYRWGANATEHIRASNEMENDYVKWGARQIDKTEFIKIASLYFARAQDRAQGTGTWGANDKTATASTNMGGSGKMVADYTYNLIPSYARWEFDFQNYKDDLQLRSSIPAAENWATFVTLNGKGRANSATINARPNRYYQNGWIDVIGPWDTPHLYTGRIQFGTGSMDAGSNLTWDGSGSRIAVIYPTGTAEQSIAFTGNNTPLDYTSQSSNGRFNTNAWR